jgi:predicted N-acetyltransferase YhbS
LSDTPKPSDAHVRAMTPDDLAAAHGLCRAVDWPHRLEDWTFNLRLGQGVVAERRGAVVGTAMCWPYGSRDASLGMVIVSPACQASGIGRHMMNRMLELLDGRNILLNATAAGLPLYRAVGFVPIGEIRQHQGASFSAPMLGLEEGERLRPIGRGDTEALIALDAGAAGTSRGALISALLTEAQCIVLDREAEPVGFALFRRFGRGYAIGPVVAPGADGAKALIAHWLASNPGIFIRIDVPADSGLSEWLDALGLVRLTPVTTMVRGRAPSRSTPSRHWAIASQALG